MGTQYKYCKNCREQNELTDNYCKKCAMPLDEGLEQKTQICSNCGEPNEVEFNYCKKCAFPLKSNLPIPEKLQKNLEKKKLSKKVIILSTLGVSLFLAFVVGISVIAVREAPKTYYDMIVRAVSEKDYVSAQKQINDYLIDYPDSEYIDEVNALLPTVNIEAENIKAAEAEAKALAEKEKADKAAAEELEKAQKEAAEAAEKAEKEKAEADKAAAEASEKASEEKSKANRTTTKPATTRPKTEPTTKSQWVHISSNIYTGVKLYLVTPTGITTYIGQVADTDDKHYDPYTNKTFRAILLIMPSGSYEWKNRDAFISNDNIFIKADDPYLQ